MEDYLADLKLRLVELFGGEHATEIRKSPPIALVTGAALFCPLMCGRAFLLVHSDDSSNGILCAFFTSSSAIASTPGANCNT